MHVVGELKVDLIWLLHLISSTVIVISLGVFHLVKNTASKYFEVDANLEGAGDRNCAMPGTPLERDSACANCGNFGTKKCSRCKSVRYCSSRCQEAHWKSGHKLKCKDFGKLNSVEAAKSHFRLRASAGGGRSFLGLALVPGSGASNSNFNRLVLFPYEEFVELYNWDKQGFPPSGLFNCGNSCFANVVLQCLTFTQPLVAFLLEKGHRSECRRNDWCFLCEFQAHVERASQSSHAFSPISILSHLPNIGGNLGYGRQEDAHEFMRFAIDRMQSVCLDEFGGEKAVHPTSQETTLIQHIFGGHLQSQVMCTRCNNISNQLENMMDLTVEIHGDAASLEQCLEQFTRKEWLLGDNMYKCDRCNDYVKAWKCFTFLQAPNILTIALKRFQSGRFGKLNKRVTFPETLDLSSYMSEEGDGTDIYKLYAVVVHVDVLNASFFGHYICYTKDFHGNWYRIDDCKVTRVELEEVLFQGAYMFLYKRVSVRASCLRTIKPPKNEQQPMVEVELDSCRNHNAECFSALEGTAGSLVFVSNSEVCEPVGNIVAKNSESNSAALMDVCSGENEASALLVDSEAIRDAEAANKLNFEFCCPMRRQVSGSDEEAMVAFSSGNVVEDSENAIINDSSSSDLIDDFGRQRNLPGTVGSIAALIEDSAKSDPINAEEPEPNSDIVKNIKVDGTIDIFSSKATATETHNLKREPPFYEVKDNGREAKRAEIRGVPPYNNCAFSH